MEMTWTKMGTFWIALSVFFSIVTPAVLAEGEWTLAFSKIQDAL